jgi:hypothetical protein
VVVVTAVGSFAYVLTAFQSQNLNSQDKLSGAQNDRLQIAFVQLYPSDPQTQFQFSLSGHMYYVQFASETSVNIYDFSASAFPGIPTKLDCLYRQIGFGVSAWVDLNLALPAGEISFARSAPNGSFSQVEFSGATWNSMTLTVLNQNTQNSGLSALSVNDRGLSSLTELLGSGNLTYINGKDASLGIPAMGSARVRESARPRSTQEQYVEHQRAVHLLQRVFGSTFTSERRVKGFCKCADPLDAIF